MSFPRRRRAPFASAFALLALQACGGGSTGPSPVASPSPASRVPGGDLTGNYTLEITPAARCGVGVRTSFPLEFRAAPTARAAGAQGTHVADFNHDPTALEIEFRVASNAVRGSVATRHDGVQSAENVQLWIHAMGDGAVTSFPGGRGEILAGTLTGYLAYGSPGSGEGSLGSCTDAAHSFRLMLR